MEIYCKNIVPRQPLLLFATRHYEKAEVMQYGISHFYAFHADGNAFDMTEVLPDVWISCLSVTKVLRKRSTSERH